MINILIGVGGTGAKVVEATMVLLAAGLGPKNLHVGLVDQDNANGNVARTRAFISDYREFRRSWAGSAPDNMIDWKGSGRGEEGLPFCRTEVTELFGDTSTWCPGGDQTTLRNTIGLNLTDKQKDLFDLLFMPGEEEQDLTLGEGYRGRAHVGAAALISKLTDPANPLTANVTELMAGGGSRTQVNIFVVGSAFGGTGAAGFPTIARELNRIRTSRNFTNKGNVAIGGALMLPYFGFAPPDANEKDLVVTTDELLPKTQLALEHYGNLFESEQAFDRFYLVGWDRFFQLGYHQAGNAEQVNPALLPELFAAAGALNFLSGGAELLQPVPAEERVRICARETKHVRWSDFPLPNVQARLGQLLRFATYWRFVVGDLVAQRRPWIGKGNWTHRLSGKTTREDALPGLTALETLLDRILRFGAVIEETALDDWDAGPWRLGAFHDPSHKRQPTDPVRLVRSHPEGPALFSETVRNDDGSEIRRDAAAVFNDLETDEKLEAGGHRGYGRVVAAAFNATRLS
ncbi:MAG TPA: hypothetical protein VGF77_09190 [Allosphingosinicella sp.]|jgi:hypothetical protein